ncbi:hypothetical protein FB451DRAFT_1559442 [Mycena latifolia]|nr:hypothetical protein FB451DRAFT_1559442 [Mycena latifolia]
MAFTIVVIVVHISPLRRPLGQSDRNIQPSHQSNTTASMMQLYCGGHSAVHYSMRCTPPTTKPPRRDLSAFLIRQRAKIGCAALLARVYYSEVDHRCANVRPPAADKLEHDSQLSGLKIRIGTKMRVAVCCVRAATATCYRGLKVEIAASHLHSVLLGNHRCYCFTTPSLATNPFAGCRSLAPAHNAPHPTFTRTTPANPVLFTLAELQDLLRDRFERHHQADIRLKDAKTELDEAISQAYHHYRLALDLRTQAITETDHARKERDTASVQCHAAHLEVERWWATEFGNTSNDKAAVARPKTVRMAGFKPKTKAVLTTKFTGVSKRTIKKRITVASTLP